MMQGHSRAENPWVAGRVGGKTRGVQEKCQCWEEEGIGSGSAEAVGNVTLLSLVHDPGTPVPAVTEAELSPPPAPCEGNQVPPREACFCVTDTCSGLPSPFPAEGSPGGVSTGAESLALFKVEHGPLALIAS